MSGNAASLRTEWEGSDAEFLLWVASWLDKIDPILAALYNNAKVLPDPSDRHKMAAWLAGNDVQDKLREIADGLA